MSIFNEFKKVFLLLSIIIFVFSGSFFANYIFDAQTQALSLLAEDHICEMFKSNQRDLNIADLSKKLHDKAVDLGLDLDFNGEILRNKSYIFHGINRVTRDKICEIEINKFVANPIKISCNLNPNCDGCLKSSHDGSLSVNKQLEAVFEKVNDRVDIRADLLNAQNFSRGDKNRYKVIQHPSLCQEVSGPCGYYSINNLLMSHSCKTGIDNILDRVKFDKFYKKLIGYNGGKYKISNIEIEKIINNNLKELCRNNVIISAEIINKLNCFDAKNVITFGESNSAKERIIDFQLNGAPQYLIVCTPEKRSQQDVLINGLGLNWDNSFDRFYCVEGHAFVLKIEWQDSMRPGKCPVILTIFDSSGPSDSRFAKLIHWYYFVFTHTTVVPEFSWNNYFSDKLSKFKSVFSLS